MATELSARVAAALTRAGELAGDEPVSDHHVLRALLTGGDPAVAAMVVRYISTRKQILDARDHVA